MKYITLAMVMVSSMFSQDDGPTHMYDESAPALFATVQQSTKMAQYFMNTVTVDGEAASFDAESSDWIGAFRCEAWDGDECASLGKLVGARNWSVCNGNTCEVQIMGYDSTVPELTEGYMQYGDIPVFMIYDASSDQYLSASASTNLAWQDGIFVPIFYGIDDLHLVSGSEYPLLGCTDESACNYIEYANIDDGSCLLFVDCNGECGGTAWASDCGCVDSDNSGDDCDDCGGTPYGSATIDNCGVCVGGTTGAEACTQDCAGDWGGSAIIDNCNNCAGGTTNVIACEEDCAGEWGGDATEDGCGVCNGDNSSCTGCTNSDAANHDVNNLFDDGSCIFSADNFESLSANPGPAKVYLSWENPNDSFENTSEGYSFSVFTSGGEELYSGISSTNAAISGLSSDNEHCFYIVATHNEYGTMIPINSNTACATPTSVEEHAWRMQITASIDSYDQFQFSGDDSWLLKDEQNYIGAHAQATYGWDTEFDAPEPPNGPGNYIKLYFDHPEWDSWVTHFTEDIVLDDHDFFSTNLTQWDGKIESDVPGSASISFKVDIGSVPENYQIYMLLEDHHEGHEGIYYRINRDGETSVDFYMDGSGQQNFSVFVGNIPPQAPDGLVSLAEKAAIGLEWESDLENGEDLQDIGDRYPATRWHVYRDDQPGDPDSNVGLNNSNGPGGCGGTKSLLSYLHFGSEGLGHTDFHDSGVNGDDTPIYPDFPNEGLLQESGYTYVVTGSNDAGESSEGHTVRMSGGQDQRPGHEDKTGDTFYAGRWATVSDTTLSNDNPVSVPIYQESPNGTNYCWDTQAGCQDGEWSWEGGIYEIPHNFNNDANKIGIKVAGWESIDTDYPYNFWENPYDFQYSWTLVSGDTDYISNIVGDKTPELTFAAENHHDNSHNNDGGSKFYTWNLNTTTEHPVKDSGECGIWTTKAEFKSADQDITIEIRPEPNADPIAAAANLLWRSGDGASVTTSNQFDGPSDGGENDFNDYDANEGVWYEPHNNSIDNNKADLYFSAYHSQDGDGKCGGDDAPTCVLDCPGWTGLTDMLEDMCFAQFPEPDESASDTEWEQFEKGIESCFNIGFCNWLVPVYEGSDCFNDCDSDMEEEIDILISDCAECDANPDDLCYLFECDEGEIEDCSTGDCVPADNIGDGWCDNEDMTYGLDLSCHDGEEADCDGNGCPNGYVNDCSGDGDCCPEAWVGDGYSDCEDQAYGCDLSCHDGEECGESTDGESDGGAGCNWDEEVECSAGGQCIAISAMCDGVIDCDNGHDECHDGCENACDFVPCFEIPDDNGNTCGDFVAYGYAIEEVACVYDYDCSCTGEVDCETAFSEGCPDGFIEDCSGDGDCSPGSYLGDGYCDGVDQEWGFDLSCYDNDNGDCNSRSANKEYRWATKIGGDRKISKDYLDQSQTRGGRSTAAECDEQSYEWFWTQATAAGMEFTDENGDGIFQIGEPFFVAGSDQVYEGYDLGDYVPTGMEQYGSCNNCFPTIYQSDFDDQEVGEYGYEGMDLHAEFNAGIYIVTLKVTDIYGDTDYSSIIFIVNEERNDGPSVGDLRNQETYYISYGKNDRQTFVGRNDCEIDGLAAADPDNDNLIFEWDYSYDAAGTNAPDGDGELAYVDGSDDSYYAHINGDSPELTDADGDGWFDIGYDLEEGDHTFTFTAIDPYGESASSSTTLKIRREPDAKPASVQVEHVNLKYVTLNISDNDLEESLADDCYGDYYDGDLDNTRKIELSNDGNVIETFRQDNDGNWSADNIDQNGSGEEVPNEGFIGIQIDKHLQASTTYHYTVQSFNDDDQLGGVDASSSTYATTGTVPTVTVDSPNGAEIRSIGDLYDIDFTTSGDCGGTVKDCQAYISKIEVFYLRNGIDEEAGTDESGNPQVSDSGWNIDGNASGNTTVNFEISDDSGIETNYQAKVLVRVHDIGDYDGGNIEKRSDESDFPFTMAAHTLSKEFGPGWKLLGSPLVVPAENDWLVDIFSQTLGQWGSDWVAYDSEGVYSADSLHIKLGQGYYVALADSQTLELSGNPIIADEDCVSCDDDSFGGADITLKKGWNLIANPLVNKVSKERFTVSWDDSNGGDLLFDDAVDAGWIAPTIYGWFENSYESIERILPWGGYFVNTSRELTLKVRPHLFDGQLTRKAQDMVAVSTLEIRANDVSGESVNDLVVIGLLDNASDEFVYGEDEFDLPRYAYTSMGGQYIDLKIGNDLMKDMKSSDYDDYQSWNISIASDKVDNNIQLSWGDISGMGDNVYLVVNDEPIDMGLENSILLSNTIEEVAIVIGNVDSYLNPIPTEFGLKAAYPNPFNPTTNLGLALNEDGLVNMSVFNVRGQVVEVLVDHNMKAGYHNITWNADGISSGMYFVKVETGGNMAMQKLMLLK